MTEQAKPLSDSFDPSDNIRRFASQIGAIASTMSNQFDGDTRMSDEINANLLWTISDLADNIKKQLNIIETN